MKRILTADGSHSLYLEDIDEQYHSKHGSITESQHIFIEAGLYEKAKEMNSIKVFEVGMGTGLNVFLTAIASAKSKLSVYLESIEAFPLRFEEAGKLNYAELLNEDNDLFLNIHLSDWNRCIQLNPNVELKKVNGKLQDYVFNEQFDLIYFDAFSPDKQEELWSKNIFEKLFNAMRKDGILVTYCVKGVIRRRLQSLGFEIEKLPGPKNGKREMLRARKRED